MKSVEKEIETFLLCQRPIARRPHCEFAVIIVADQNIARPDRIRISRT